VPSECLNNGIQAKTPAQNVSFMANGQQSVDTTCETGMRDSSSSGVGRTASDGARSGVAAAAGAASDGPFAHPHPHPGAGRHAGAQRPSVQPATLCCSRLPAKRQCLHANPIV